MNQKLLEEVQMLQSSSDRLLLESAEQQRQLVAHYEAVSASFLFFICLYLSFPLLKHFLHSWLNKCQWTINICRIEFTNWKNKSTN
jgi:hypothetical protein